MKYLSDCFGLQFSFEGSLGIQQQLIFCQNLPNKGIDSKMVVHSKFQEKCTSPTFMENCTLATFANNEPDNTMTDCLMWSMTGLSFTLGNLMLFGLYHYEKFGEDPAKRSLFNRLVSQCLIACSVQTNTGNFLLILSRKVIMPQKIKY